MFYGKMITRSTRDLAATPKRYNNFSRHFLPAFFSNVSSYDLKPRLLIQARETEYCYRYYQFTNVWLIKLNEQQNNSITFLSGSRALS